MKPADYHLTIRLEPRTFGTPDSRLKAALKVLLRGFGIRAVSIEPVKEQGQDGGTQG